MNTFVDLTSSDPAPADLAPVLLYKSERGFNIDVAALAKDFKLGGAEKIRVIDIPSIVREQRRGDEITETPTLPEIGATQVSHGMGYSFCQVVAGTDGRPVNIDSVLYVNSDPANTSSTLGVVSIAMGTYFAVGWLRNSDSLVLIYRVVQMRQYVVPGRDPNDRERDSDRSKSRGRDIAQVTCELQGWMRRSWRSDEMDIPQELEALYVACSERLQTDYAVPMYMDMIRMTAGTDLSRATSEQMKQQMFGAIENFEPDVLMRRFWEETIDIRRNQYAKLEKSEKTRKVKPLSAVETLTLERGLDGVVTVAIEIVIPRDDDALPLHMRTVLTADNFFTMHGRTVLDRGLTLKQISFEKLCTEFETRRGPIVTVHVTTIR
jgi:hypothetical protein